ncbi:MAG: glycoside hydrolase family 13 protein [Clostridia bacterium]|nr:glycoside hydrolase family 13 protein [Clostridia bacterium]MDY2901073.1 glycoside hydrolase family 13 protein [Christensenellaceae bacterium]
MHVTYDPISRKFKSVTGAASDSEQININIKISGAESCCLVLTRDDSGENTTCEAERSGDEFRFTLPPLRRGLYFYRFYADGRKIGKDGFGFGADGEYTDDFQLLVYKSGAKAPRGFHGGVMYQIFPDRFARAEGFGNAEGKRLRNDICGMPEYLPDENGKIKNDDFFGGNFEGIRRKTHYLKSLGVTHVYLNPIFKAHSNHRYDTGDYMTFDPLLGSEADFTSLVKTFKNNDISLIFDGVFNHTGDDSIYFNKYGNYPSVGAYQSKESPYYGWYEFQKFPDEYSSWWGVDILPSINKNCLPFEEFITGDSGVLEKYFKLGAGGVRLDVVDEINDRFVEKITAKVKSFGDDKIVIGEVWEDATNKIAYGTRRQYFCGNELDSVMNYPLKDAIIDFALSGKAEAIYKTVRKQIDNYPFYALNSLMNILGTHDTPRILTVLGKRGRLEKERSRMAEEKLTQEEKSGAIKMLKCCSLLQFCLYGVPCIYYGDEQITEGNKDPFNRTFFVENENKELYEWYCFLSELRKRYDCFKDGETADVYYNDGLFSFSRNCENKKIYFAVNFGERPMSILPDGMAYEITRGVKLSKIIVKNCDFAIFYKVTE